MGDWELNFKLDNLNFDLVQFSKQTHHDDCLSVSFIKFGLTIQFFIN